MAIRDLIPWKREEAKAPVGRDEEHPLQVWHHEMDDLFDEFFRGFGVQPVRAFDETWDAFSPRLDVVETEEELKISAELPGLDEKDIEVSLSRDVLTIGGEKKEEKEARGKNYYRTERSYGSFRRSVELPCNVDTGKVDATFSKGVLTIRLPKTGDVRACRRVPVKSG